MASAYNEVQNFSMLTYNHLCPRRLLSGHLEAPKILRCEDKHMIRASRMAPAPLRVKVLDQELQPNLRAQTSRRRAGVS